MVYGPLAKRCKEVVFSEVNVISGLPVPKWNPHTQYTQMETKPHLIDRMQYECCEPQQTTVCCGGDVNCLQLN